MEDKIYYENAVSNREAHVYDENILIIYDCKSGKFKYPVSIQEEFAASFDSRPLWQIMLDDGITSESTAQQFLCKIQEMSAADTMQVYFAEYLMRDIDMLWKWYRVGFICTVPGERISITVTDIDDEVAEYCRLTRLTKYDELTGILNRNAFSKAIRALVENNKEAVAAGEYAIVFFDVLRFKAINEMFGVKEGDRLLKYIADAIMQVTKSEDLVCRLSADKFMFITHTVGSELKELIEKLLDIITSYHLPFKIVCNMGIYVTDKGHLSVGSMVDRAVLAQAAIKGSYIKQYNFYTETLRNDMMSEQEISGMMFTALEEKQFVLYYQPQYNHSTGMLVGAEALVRWNHPERGLISPGIFIPIFEKNGFITELDLYVFEQSCSFIRQCMDKGMSIVPISSNFSQHDIFRPDFVECLEERRLKYDVPVKYLRIEITESVAIGGSEHVNSVVKKLHDCGYIVEMDDFGSGYSSLNILKDIDLDMIKLDMLFLSKKSESNRGGTIISSVVRMAKWLNMPVIAEGVETADQADFLRSIGCNYIQGYLYSKPLPENQYEELLQESEVGKTVSEVNLIETLNADDFWDSKSLETLIFSNYVGGAVIFEYHNGKIEVLRVNKKYLQEMGMNLSEKELIETDMLSEFDDENQKIYRDMLERAIASEDEEECETWRRISVAHCGDDKICIRSNVRMIGKSGDTYLFYAMIRNITAEKARYTDILDSERRFKMASEQVNIYYWEYTVATKEMRPCFRCMRDLGLPAVMTNYPESAIEMGVFPPEVADEYRDWHRQIAEGAPELEAVMPLTMDRIPFRVRYTTEFDENGRPVKAYGSAVLIVD